MFLRAQSLSNRSYHPQAKGQAEHYTKTIVPRWHHYVAKHQQDWESIVQPFAHTYTSQVFYTTGTTCLA